MEEEKTHPASRDDRLFRSAFAASPIGIALEDLEGRPLFANPALCSMLGFSEEEMRTKHCVEFSPPEDAAKDCALFEQLRAGSINHYQLKKRFCRRDGSLIWGRLSISLLESGTSRLVIAMVEDLSKKTTAPDKLLQSEAQRENLGGLLIQAQDEERARIARELRDDIHQQLVLLSLDLDLLRRNFRGSAAEITQKISEAREQVIEVCKDIQSLSHRLHSVNLEYLGISAAATSLCREIADRQKLEIDFNCEGIPEKLPKEIALCLYRVLQEALQNAVKHSGSRHFEVSLRGDLNEVQLNVRDWGIGFESAAAVESSGLGIVSMRERLKLFDGDFSIESQPHGGTTIRARVPL